MNNTIIVTTPLWNKCEDETHILKSGNLESFGTPATSELNIRGKNTLPWGVLYTMERPWSVDVKNGFAWAIWTSIAQVMVERRIGSQTDNLTPDHKKLGIDPTSGCAEAVWHTLESSWGELQDCFRPHPNPRSEPRVTSSQSPGSPNRDNFGTPP